MGAPLHGKVDGDPGLGTMTGTGQRFIEDVGSASTVGSAIPTPTMPMEGASR